jgi:hypothetical protein
MPSAATQVWAGSGGVAMSMVVVVSFLLFAV